MLHSWWKSRKKVEKMGQKEKHSERNWKIQISEKKKSRKNLINKNRVEKKTKNAK